MSTTTISLRQQQYLSSWFHNNIERCEYDIGKLTLTGDFDIYCPFADIKHLNGKGKLVIEEGESIRTVCFYDFNGREDVYLPMFLSPEDKKWCLKREEESINFETRKYIKHEFSGISSVSAKASYDSASYFQNRFKNKQKHISYLVAPFYLYHDNLWYRIPYEYYSYFKIKRVLIISKISDTYLRLICLTDESQYICIDFNKPIFHFTSFETD